MLVFCAVRCSRSHKRIAKAVRLLDLSLIPPMIGNLIIIGSSIKEFSLIGCYIFFIGMDLVMAALVNFTAKYCKAFCKSHRKSFIMYILLGLDAAQMMLNPFFGHAFDLEATIVQDLPYYRLVPFYGQTIHRVVIYTVFFFVILVFIIASIKTARIYRERYSIILIVMALVGLWETFYIFSRTPVDRSMIGYGVFGILVYYISLIYRPLRLLDRILSNIASDMTEALYVFDPTGRCIWSNQPGLDLLDITEGELDEVNARLSGMFGKRPFTREDWKDNRILGHGDDALYYYLENHYVNADRKHLAGSYLMIRDNTEEQRRIKREIYNSTHDSLTGLFTKQHLYECIRNTLEEKTDDHYAAVFVDVKNFKIVNDIFSSAFGDIALQQIADWLRNNMAGKCLFGRIGGDTFGVFMSAEEFAADKEKIEKELLNFIVTDGNVEHRLLIHIGVYEVSDRSLDVSVMFDRAHLAISTISGNFKKHIAYYDQKLREKVLLDQRITAGLQKAINTMQIRPYLQPITNRSGKVVGAEALARWIHPEQGFMSPAMFIPILEKNGLIIEVDRHIWRCACKILASWKGTHDDLFISVNISPKDFYFIDIVSEITGLVKEYDISPQKLRIEITETVMMTDVEDKFRMLNELRRLGFIVEMDDFGSGYSSLNLLKEMPVDVLKIDMKFLSSSDSDKKAQTIIRNIIKLSEELNIVSLTEGVETQQQYSELSDMGCKLFQGYFFAKPLPTEEFESFAFVHSTIS